MCEYDEQQCKEQFMKLARNEIRIAYQKAETSLSPCASKISGMPAVPHDFVWPRYEAASYDTITKNRPLSFMIQINLKDVQCFDTEQLLPKQGILSFFYEQITMPWGFYPEHKDSARVYYFPDVDELTPQSIPEDMETDATMPEFAITYEQHISLPEAEDFPEDATEMEISYEQYNECRSACGYEVDEWGDVTKLLGYPDTIQSSMEKECETLTRGYRQGSPEDIKDISEAVKADIETKAKDWILLFQMGTIETEEMEYMFGDCGHIYFWIRKEDLKNLKFDRTWMILQCC